MWVTFLINLLPTFDYFYKQKCFTLLYPFLKLSDWLYTCFCSGKVLTFVSITLNLLLQQKHFFVISPLHKICTYKSSSARPIHSKCLAAVKNRLKMSKPPNCHTMWCPSRGQIVISLRQQKRAHVFSSVCASTFVVCRRIIVHETYARAFWRTRPWKQARRKTTCFAAVMVVDGNTMHIKQ